MRDFGLLDSFETHHENYFSSGQVLTYKQKIVFTKITKTKKKAQQECYHCDNFRNFFSNFRGVLDESNSETCSMRFLFFFYLEGINSEACSMRATSEACSSNLN